MWNAHRDLAVRRVARLLRLTSPSLAHLRGEGEEHRVREAVLLVEHLEGALLALVRPLEQADHRPESDLRQVDGTHAAKESGIGLLVTVMAEEEKTARRQRDGAFKHAVGADLPRLPLVDDDLLGRRGARVKSADSTGKEREGRRTCWRRRAAATSTDSLPPSATLSPCASRALARRHGTAP